MERSAHTLSVLGPFPRSSRLRRSREFAHVHRHGARESGRGFVVLAVHRDGQVEPRFGCAIGKKVGNAVLRNRLRRLLRETFRRSVDRISPADIVVIVRPGHLSTKPSLDAVSAVLGPSLERTSRRACQKRSKGKIS